MAEFSDRPLPEPSKEEDYYGFFPAKYVTKYLEDYADNHVYADRSIRDRIRFDCHINAIRKEDDLWVVSAVRKKESRYGVFDGDENGPTCDFRAPKLMVATGLSSLPAIPEFPDRKAFKGFVLHHKDFGQSAFLASSDVQHVCVIGGAKSAADVVYASAKAGKTVSWIIRQNGSGPSALAPAKGSGPYRNANETLYTRMTSLFNPSPYVPQMWVTKFLHQSRIGRKFVAFLWARTDAKNRRLADYGRPDGRINGFDKLAPDTP
ncbi:MAG: hypothetical protein LQ347_006569 [Umbilicaria vellea]|nr:MAG: hypothetical protein LQ347_006569 [Umbilicaria vellea]